MFEIITLILFIVCVLVIGVYVIYEIDSAEKSFYRHVETDCNSESNINESKWLKKQRKREEKKSKIRKE